MTTAPNRKKKNNQIDIFSFLLANEKATYSEIKRALKLPDKSLSYALIELIEKGVVNKNDRYYTLNPVYKKQKELTKLVNSIIMIYLPYIDYNRIGDNIKLLVDYITKI